MDQYEDEGEGPGMMPGQEGGGMPYNPFQTPMDKYGSNMSDLTNPKSALYNFELSLRCLREDEKGTLIKIGGSKWKPLLNDQGVNGIMGLVESVVHGMNPLSNFVDRDINWFHTTLLSQVLEVLIFKRKDWEIERKHRSLILGNCMRFAHGFMQRAFEEGDRQFWKGSVHEHKTTTDVAPQRGGGSYNPFSKSFVGRQ